jgi:hypothetical protein
MGLLFYEKNGVSNEVSMDEKAAIEKMNLSKQLDDDDCAVVFMIIDTMLTKRCLEIYFRKM